MSLDKSFEIQSGDQEDDWKFVLQANYFCCHLECKYTNTQRAYVQRWIFSVAQNFAMKWCHRFFKTLLEYFDQANAHNKVQNLFKLHEKCMTIKILCLSPKILGMQF